MERGSNSSEPREHGALNPHSNEFEEGQEVRPVKNVLIDVEGDVNTVAERLGGCGVLVTGVDEELGIVMGTIYADTEADILALKWVRVIYPASDIELHGE